MQLEREQQDLPVSRVTFTTSSRLVATPAVVGAAEVEAEKERNPVEDIFQNLEDTVCFFRADKPDCLSFCSRRGQLSNC